MTPRSKAASGTRDLASALLLDLDGVVRVFDPAVPAAIERRYALPAGTLARSALAWHRLRPAIVGQKSHAAWLESIVADLTEAAGGPEPARAAVREWQADRGTVVPEVIEFVREVRRAGMPVGLATNSTSVLSDDLDSLRLTGEFDVVVNSSVIGFHKPTREFFSTACVAVATAPARCFFVDDDDRHVRGARVAGLSAYRWNGAADVPYLRAALALPPEAPRSA
jgi:putative hydrolase of the HAD superfamily